MRVTYSDQTTVRELHPPNTADSRPAARCRYSNRAGCHWRSLWAASVWGTLHCELHWRVKALASGADWVVSVRKAPAADASGSIEIAGEWPLDIQILNLQCVLLNELPSRLHLLAH